MRNTVINKLIPKKQGDARSNHQQLFVRYTFAVLIDLVVLNLFNEFWEYVLIDSFLLSLFAAILLQILLQATLVVEHKLANYFKSKSGVLAKISRFFSTWAVLFVSKLVILETINITFGDHVLFTGPIHGVVVFIVVVVAILLAEFLVERVYKSLA